MDSTNNQSIQWPSHNLRIPWLGRNRCVAVERRYPATEGVSGTQTVGEALSPGTNTFSWRANPAARGITGIGTHLTELLQSHTSVK